MFMQMAHIVAQRGTCSRAQVGAIIVRDGRVISMGYNGAPPGMPHCEHYDSPHNREGCTIATHAELNAIIFSARQGIPTDAATMYSTHCACATCARALVAAGITEFIYQTEYRLVEGYGILFDANVKVRQYARDSGDPQVAEDHWSY